MVRREQRYQNVALSTFLQANVDSVPLGFVRLALPGF